MLSSLQSLLYAVGSIATGVLLQTSCFTVINPPDGGDDNPPAEKVTIRLINLSSYTLDPQLHVSDQPLGDPAATLFLPANIRVAPDTSGTGIMQPGQTAEIVVDCTAAAAIGTLGGRFLNRSDGSEAGTGQQRLSPIGQVYSCTDVLTFTYQAQNSTFTTSISGGIAN